MLKLTDQGEIIARCERRPGIALDGRSSGGSERLTAMRCPQDEIWFGSGSEPLAIAKWARPLDFDDQVTDLKPEARHQEPGPAQVSHAAMQDGLNWPEALQATSKRSSGEIGTSSILGGSYLPSLAGFVLTVSSFIGSASED